jgi:uncharacterized protein (TIGR03437 family)
MTRLASVALFLSLPAAILAESQTPSIGYAGAPTDHGGANCSTCHTGLPLNAPSGSLQVTVSNYVPSVQQLIKVVIQNSNASRWGFQMTIRGQSNQTLSAGTFTIPTGQTNEQVMCEDGTQFGSAAACVTNTGPQFAEHQNAPQGKTGASYEFDVLWTPPEQEIGRLEVYVAAVAANGDGNDTGDYVYTYTQTLSNIGNCALSEQPTFNAIVNGASFQPGFSSGSMVSIFGTGFQTSGQNRVAGLGDYVNGAFPTELGCVSVEVSGPGIDQAVPIPIAYASFGQINAQMPNFSGTGPVMLTVTVNPGSNGVNSPVATLSTLQEYSPAFFVFPNSTSIAAEEATSGAIVADPTVVAGASAASPGDIVSLFGTGFGAVNPAVAPGGIATGQATVAGAIKVTLGGQPLPESSVMYAGLSPGSISGLYQFNIQIPASAPTGDVPVTIEIGGVQTQAGATIPIQ